MAVAAMQERVRLAHLRVRPLGYTLRSFPLVILVEGRVLRLGSEVHEAIHLLKMMSQRCGETRRQTAGEDRVRCHGRARVAKVQDLRQSQLPCCPSLVEGCALLLLLG